MPQDERVTAVVQELARLIDKIAPILQKLADLPAVEKRYIDSEEVAARMNCHKQQVAKLIREGCPHYEIGKGPQFLWSEVQAFMYTHRRHSGELEQWLGAQRGRRAS